MKFLSILIQIICYVSLGLSVEYLDFSIAMVGFCFYILGMIATIVNFEMYKPSK